VEDFFLLAQGPRAQWRAARFLLFHGIDEVFFPNQNGNTPTRKEPNLMKKLFRGNAAFSTRNKILGWILDTLALTIMLPRARFDKMDRLLAQFPWQQRLIFTCKWQCLLGNLRIVAPIIPGGLGLFSVFQQALPPYGCVRLNQSMPHTMS